jgi:hypothetical protein
MVHVSREVMLHPAKSSDECSGQLPRRVRELETQVRELGARAGNAANPAPEAQVL